MSYILDALKKADSERKLGSIPNIYAAAPADTSTAHDQSARRKWFPWMLALNILALAAAAAAWIEWRQPSSAPAATVTTISPTEQIAASPVATPPANQLQKVNPMPAATVPKGKPEQNLQQTQTLAQPLPVVSVAPLHESNTEKTDAPISTPATHASEEKPVGTLHDLPENIQREVPTATINGYIYAKNPADRSVLINNKLLHEGEQVEPGLILEKMMSNGVVLNFKGYRFRLSY